MKLLKLLIKRSWFTVLFSGLASLVSGVGIAAIIALINQALDPAGSSELQPWTFLGLCGLTMLTTIASQVSLVRLSQYIVRDSQLQLTQQILSCPLRQLEKIGQPRLLAALTEDVDTISRSATWIAGLGVNSALVLGCLTYLGWMSFPAFLGLFTFMILSSICYQKMVDQGAEELRSARETRDQLFEHFRSVVEGIKELKLHHNRRQSFLNDELWTSSSAFAQFRIKAMSLFAIANSWALILFFVAIGALIFLIREFIDLPTQVLSSYALTIIFMINPLRGILNTLPQLSQANVALNKIENLGFILSKQGIDNDSLAPASLTHPNNDRLRWNQLEFVDVKYTYTQGSEEESPFSLGPINLTLNSQEIIFIVGGNGSGKSTLIKLITGLYIPDSGKIEIDYDIVGPLNREGYRELFSAIFADYYLFKRLIGIDIAHKEKEISTYLRQLHLDKKVTVQDGMLSSIDLSQGQKKRLALLTALLEDRSIYVFDEWASDQDPVYKTVFYRQLVPELKQRGKTVFVISHDDRYFDTADRVLRLEDGQIVQDSYR
jgi:putative ATP-binding cassette transporter